MLAKIKPIGFVLIRLIIMFCVAFTFFTISHIVGPASYETPESFMTDLHSYKYYLWIAFFTGAIYLADIWFDSRDKKEKQSLTP